MKNNKKKIEKSFICLVAILLFGMTCVVTYYVAIFMEKSCDPIVATTSLTTIIGGLLSYFLYQFGLKNSRNKYGVDETGQPFKLQINEEVNNEPEEDNIEDEEEIEAEG